MIKDFIAKNLLSIAMRFHEEYNKHVLKTNPSAEVVPWEKLNDDYKYSNIRIVETLDERLDKVDCYVTNDCTGKTVVDDFGEDTDRLAFLEHEMWMREREESGWIYGPKRDDDKKIHDMMKPWWTLSADEREKDYLIIRSIIPILREFGIYVCRRSRTGTEKGEFRHYEANRIPLLISVTGHTDIRKEDEPYIEKCLSEMLNDLT